MLCFSTEEKTNTNMVDMLVITRTVMEMMLKICHFHDDGFSENYYGNNVSSINANGNTLIMIFMIIANVTLKIVII